MSDSATPPEDHGKILANDASVLRYPFCDMNMQWWEEYILRVPAETRTNVMLRVMDCLMAHAILHEDPFLEEAVIRMSAALPKTTQPRHATQDLISAFESAHHVFKAICITAKFPTQEAKGKQDILSMVQSRIRDIEKVSKKPSFRFGPTVVPTSVEVVCRLQALQKNMDSRQAFMELMESLKRLFFTVSTRNGVTPRFDVPGARPFDTFVCCDGCLCYGRLRASYTIFLRDVEKAKVIDCIMIAAIKESDDLMRDVASELRNEHFRDFMENPAVDDIGRFIHNGRLFYCRAALFTALNMIHHLSELHSSGSNPLGRDGDSYGYMDRIVLSLLWVKSEVQGLRYLTELVPLLDRTLTTAEGAYARLGEGNFREDLHTLKDYTTAAFTALSAPEYHLAVHSRDVFVGKPADMKCASPSCPGTTKELLKCSGCDVTYYCSAQCQKADWDKHKNFCHEIESRRSKPAVIKCQISPMQCIKPAV